MSLHCGAPHPSSDYTVTHSIGVLFAPHHFRDGGTLAQANWAWLYFGLIQIKDTNDTLVEHTNTIEPPVITSSAALASFPSTSPPPSRGYVICESKG